MQFISQQSKLARFVYSLPLQYNGRRPRPLFPPRSAFAHLLADGSHHFSYSKLHFLSLLPLTPQQLFPTRTTINHLIPLHCWRLVSLYKQCISVYRVWWCMSSVWFLQVFFYLKVFHSLCNFWLQPFSNAFSFDCDAILGDYMLGIFRIGTGKGCGYR